MFKRAPTAPETISKTDLKAVIMDSLAARYTSHSIKDNIATGNRYQTVRLGEEEIAGFRSTRQPLFEAIDFTGSSVLDIGSNLGEASRSAYAHGATKVLGLEYDQLFVTIAQMVNLHEGISRTAIEFRQADVTRGEIFPAPVDYVLALSVFTYMGGRVKEIADNTRRALIVETHNLEKPTSLNSYLSAITPHFETTVLAGYSDWGAGSDFSGGKRAYVLGFKSKREFWNFVIRAQKVRPTLSCLSDLDLMASVPPSLSRLRGDNVPTDDALKAVGNDRFAYEAFGLPYPNHSSHLGYWLEFRRGYLHAKTTGGNIDFDNPYVKLMQKLVSEGDLFDPGAMKEMHDRKLLLERCTRRINSFNAIESAAPAVIFYQPEVDKTFVLKTCAGETLTCTTIDGQHRMAAAIMSDKRTYPAYHFTVAGKM